MSREVPDVAYDPSKPMAKLRVVYHHPLGNVPGFSMVCIEVATPPGGATPPHSHGDAAIVGLVTVGTTYNKMNDEPTMLIPAGGTFYEAPGCHHRTSANASDTEDMVIMATVVMKTELWENEGLKGLVHFDKEWAYLQDAVPPA